MNRDFTLSIYRRLIEDLLKDDFIFLRVADYLLPDEDTPKIVVLRHDIDARPENALKMAQLEYQEGIKATYYFRAVKNTFKPDIIKNISEMDHEIGYHYEDLAACKGNQSEAWDSFRKNLAEFRKICAIKTICMHGSPLQPYDNRDLWKKYDYKDEEIIGEPYLSMDFSKISYLTDTGRRWDGFKFNIRDKTQTGMNSSYRTTFDIINAVKKGRFPSKALITTHPQRWDDSLLPWATEYFSQRVKNIIKSVMVSGKHKHED